MYIEQNINNSSILTKFFVFFFVIFRPVLYRSSSEIKKSYKKTVTNIT